MALSDPARQRLHELLSASCDGRLDDTQADILRQLLLDPDAQQYYVRFAMLDACLDLASVECLEPLESPAAPELNSLPSPLGRGTQGVPGGEGGVGETRPSPLSRSKPRSPVLGFLNSMMHVSGDTPVTTALLWMIMLLFTSTLIGMIVVIAVMIHGINVHVDQPIAEKPPVAAPLPNPQSPIPNPPSSPVARLIHAADCRWADDSDAPEVGDDLAPGRKLVLRSGLAELMFTSGAKALLQGPATLEVGSKTSALLRRGKVTVTVLDPDARGFEIDTPGMKYTDLGTEFGVLVATDGVQEVHVFRGKVAAEQAPMRDEGSGMRNTKLPSPSGRGAGGEGPQPLILTANQAIRVASSGKPVERFAADERRFVRVMPQPKTLPVPIFNTGQGLVPGQPDPHWQIIAVPGDAKLQPRPATVAPATVHRAWDKFTSPQSKWISVTADTVAPPGMFQYRTQFDLGGIDPSSVVLKCGFAVDNRLVAVRLNGREIAVPRHSEKIEYNSFVKFQIDCQGLKPRQNTLEFVVENTGPGNSWSGLRVEFQGTGREISNHK